MKLKKEFNKKVLIICFIFLLMISLVTATVVNYVSNQMSTQVTIKTTCNDGIDNDGDLLVDSDDPDCLTACNKEDDSGWNCV